MSREIAPVGMTDSGARVSSPRRITEPLPNCFSMLASAASRAFSRFVADMGAVLFCPRLTGLSHRSLIVCGGL